MYGSGKSSEQRQREKERKKRKNRKYGQAASRHSRKGILSCWEGAAAVLIIAGCILNAFFTRGEAVGVIGGIMIVSLIFIILGVRSAILGFRERDCNYLTCRIGLVLNAVALIAFLAIFIGGFGV